MVHAKPSEPPVSPVYIHPVRSRPFSSFLPAFLFLFFPARHITKYNSGNQSMLSKNPIQMRNRQHRAKNKLYNNHAWLLLSYICTPKQTGNQPAGRSQSSDNAPDGPTRSANPKPARALRPRARARRSRASPRRRARGCRGCPRRPRRGGPRRRRRPLRWARP